MGGAPIFAGYRSEVLRWNESINLVSRRDTEAQLDALLAQCDNALAAWRRATEPLGLAADGRDVLYLDLGSGGGLPAVVWHERLAAAAGRLRTVLVEPREKRAWFLERVARDLTTPTPDVLACRWNEAAATAVSSPELVIVSLKALRLKDGEVLAGMAPFLAAGAQVDLTIARFHPQDQTWSDELVSSLGIPEPGALGDNVDYRAEANVSGLLPAGEASLVISRYRYERR